MVKRLLVFTLMAAAFFVGAQFMCVYFYVFEFDDFVKDEVKFAPIREMDTKEHLVEHITRQAMFYSLTIDDIKVHRNTDIDSGLTTLAVDLNYTAAVDLYYTTPLLHRQLHASTIY